ncbi:hypothetical protein BGZ65_007703 [Modicella reniformis]|uniref:Uncharacterized protein n=1 Tax=Modicella reniformis TaxID=1440133 RepID=A0A9P6M8A2_9FUNG|nr:hypothetical protein BGZ65_007703 [Modicella reniformis]
MFSFAGTVFVGLQEIVDYFKSLGVPSTMASLPYKAIVDIGLMEVYSGKDISPLEYNPKRHIAAHRLDYTPETARNHDLLWGAVAETAWSGAERKFLQDYVGRTHSKLSSSDLSTPTSSIASQAASSLQSLALPSQISIPLPSASTSLPTPSPLSPPSHSASGELPTQTIPIHCIGNAGTGIEYRTSKMIQTTAIKDVDINDALVCWNHMCLSFRHGHNTTATNMRHSTSSW